jgi:hypothetical protein
MRVQPSNRRWAGLETKRGLAGEAPTYLLAVWSRDEVTRVDSED